MDARIRGIERAADEDPEARDEWLKESIRAGAISTDRLKLAAYCGDVAARRLVALPLTVERQDRRSRTKGFVIEKDWSRADNVAKEGEPGLGLETWSYLLTFWPDDVIVRAAVEAASLALAARSASGRGADGIEARAIQTARDWLACPCHEHAERVRANPEVTIRSGGKRTEDAWWGGVISLVLWVNDGLGFEALQGFATVFADTLLGASDVVGSEEAVRGAVAKGLIAWALGATRREAGR